mmetsp:Transcript_13716/g.21419  ORF Transcript_13716/g.21419 Transcript_13716/m.21419 type:complete len:91 (+) Transcript_13716:215-487(+)
MFALLVQLQGKSGAEGLISSLLPTQSLDETVQSPELIAKEKQKAEEGFCETALWNCTDLCESIPRPPAPRPRCDSPATSWFFVCNLPLKP